MNGGCNSGWTHLVCDPCWQRRRPDRDPFRLIDPEPEPCCSCGALTLSGIYVREDPRRIHGRLARDG